LSHIELTHVGKSYPVADRGCRLVRRILSDMLRLRRWERRTTALADICFTLTDGDSLALVGANGAGKSTLLGLLAGLYPPDRGTLHVSGRVSSLLDLGFGFHPDLTGRENARVMGALLGLGRRELHAALPGIIEFSGIAAQIDDPLRTYSAGMTLRLAFAVAVAVSPDILLIDEVIAVGDAAFQAQCLAKIAELRRAGRIFVCASHNLPALRGLCNKALWLDHGQAMAYGEIDDVLAAYAGRRARAATP
jgi:ABC-type polysaccharide/polyol phosphate transport system ATPase subunit